MYNPYFHFSCSPFENTLDQRFLFLSAGHDEVIAALLYFVKEKKGFALVCGDVGTGKTMIIHHLLGNLPRSVKPILIPYPDVEYIEILRYIARVLEINPEGKGSLDLTDEVRAVLREASLEGKQVILIIDEAHLLSVKSLDDIRLLSNIEVTESNLLQILLIGQNELSHKLHRRDMRQLRQRINVNRFLSPMSPSETIAYIDHRLQVAGSSFDGCFAPGCKDLIVKMTGGVPRSINRLCDTALLVCMSEKRDAVTGKMLKKAHDALRTDVVMVPKEGKTKKSFSFEKLKPAVAGAALVLIIALGFLGYKENPGEILKRWILNPGAPGAISTNVERPLPPVPEVKSEDVSKSPGGEENSPSSNKPALVTPQSRGPAQGPAGALPGGGEAVGNKDENVVKNGAASPAVEGPGPNPAPTEETQAKDPIENANGEAAQAHAGDVARETAAKDENQGAVPDAFEIKVKKGDTLSAIAALWFPEDPESGQKSILSANPEIDDRDLIYEGQVLRIPKSRN